MQKLTSSALRGTGKFATALHFMTSNVLCWIFPRCQHRYSWEIEKKRKKDYPFSDHCILILCYLNETVNKNDQYHGITIKVASILYNSLLLLCTRTYNTCFSTVPLTACEAPLHLWLSKWLPGFLPEPSCSASPASGPVLHPQTWMWAAGCSSECWVCLKEQPWRQLHQPALGAVREEGRLKDIGCI